MKMSVSPSPKRTNAEHRPLLKSPPKRKHLRNSLCLGKLENKDMLT